MVKREPKIVIETPERIFFSYRLANVGTRAAAYTIDILIQGTILLAFALLGFFSTFSSHELQKQGLMAIAIIFLLIFFLQWFYFVFFELILNGSTPGKKICKIKVIKSSGERLDISTIVLRNLLRAADSLPFAIFNILGGFIAIINKKNKRLGDIVSDTIVVVNEGININEPDFETTFLHVDNPLITKLQRKNMLSEKDLYILRKVLNTRTKNNYSSAIVADKIVKKLDKKYDLSIFSGKSNFEIIEEVYKAHTYEY